MFKNELNYIRPVSMQLCIIRYSVKSSGAFFSRAQINFHTTALWDTPIFFKDAYNQSFNNQWTFF